MRHVCCISPKAGASFMMSSEDVISKLRKKELQRDYKSLLDENRKKMPILLPITLQADIFELFSHPQEFKETAFFCRSVLLINPSDLFNHFGGLKNINCMVFKISTKPVLPLTCMFFEMTDYCRLLGANRPWLKLIRT